MDDQWLKARMIETPRWHVSVERRRCHRHLERPAQDRCDRCGLPFCTACLAHVGQWRVCSACIAQLERERAFQAPPRRLQRARAEIVACLCIMVLVGGFSA